MGQLAVATAFAIVGNYFLPGSGPFFFAIGSYVGGLLFNDPTQGPKLTDLHLQGSSYGAPVPRIWGTFRLGGNINWRRAELQEHENESGGKGGPEQVNYSYTATYGVKICQGAERILARWSDGRLMWDNRSGTPAGETGFVFYDGNDAQLPDPTEEAIEGVGNVPAYLGYQRVVFTDRDVTQFFNRIPQDNYLVTNAPDQEQSLSRSATWTVVTPISIPMTDHRAVGDSDGIISVAYWVTGGGTPNYTTQSGIEVPWRTTTYDLDGTLLDQIDVPFTFTNNGNIFLCRNESTLSFQRGGGTSQWFKNGVPTGSGPVDGGVGDYFYGGCSEDFVYHDGNIFVLGGFANLDAYLIRYPAPGAEPEQLYDIKYQLHASTPADQFTIAVSNDGYIYVNGNSTLRKFDTDLNLLQTWTATGGAVIFPTGGSILPRAGWMICEDTILIRVNNPPGDFGSNGFLLYQMTPTLPWPEISRVLSVASPLAGVAPLWNLGDGLCLTDDGVLSVCEAETGTVLLSEIAADVFELDGLTSAQYDVSRIPFPVRGFAACTEGPMTGRAILESIFPAFFVDIDDSTGKIKCVPRGQPFCVEIPDGDLSARSENGDPPALLQCVLGDDLTIPRQIYLKFLDPNTDYQIGTVQWRRQNTESQIVATISVPVVFTVAEATRIVETWGQIALIESDAYTWYTSRKYLRYSPTDVMRVQGIDLRVTKKTIMWAEGTVKWEGVRSQAGAFAQAGIPGEGQGFVPPVIPVEQETELAMIDGPFIGDDPRQGLIPVVAQGALRRSWRGMSLQKSLDGTNYSQILVERSAGTIGETVTALGNYGGVSFDESSVLRVWIYPGGGELSSVSREAAFAGENMAVVGHDDNGVRGEVIRFKNATLISEDEDGKVYDITSMLRGRKGTAAAWMRGHAVGEKFVMLPSNSSLSLLRSDLAITRNHKPVTIGSTLADTVAYPFRSNGLPLAAYAPRFPRAGFTGTPGASDILFEWNRQSRIGQGWLNFRSPTGAGQPLGEETEGYRIRVYVDGTKQIVVNYYSDGIVTTQFLYTQAMQTADFGGPLSVLPSWNVAQKCSIGWGYDSDGGLPQFVPSATDGYVPPNPDPLDSTLSVMTWAPAAQVQALALGPDDRWAIEVTEAGGISSTPGDRANLTAVEHTGAPIPREWTFSPIRGDFGPQPKPWAAGTGNSVTQVFCVGTDTDPNYPTLALGATMYLNIRTLPTGYSSTPMICNLVNIP